MSVDTGRNPDGGGNADSGSDTDSGRTSIRERVLRPTLAELWTFLAIALPVLASLIAAMSAVDLAYQLRAGAEILGGSGIPAVDAWTFTATGVAWFDQQWGAQVLLAQVHAVAGWTGLVLLRAALVGFISGLILFAIRMRAPGMHPRTAALLALAAFVVMAPALALRPQLLAMALFALTLALLAARRAHPRAIWLVPVIAAAWANLHGSFILAPGLVGIALIEEIGDRDAVGRSGARAGARAGSGRMLIVLIATVAATVVTPFGWRVWEYAVGIARNAQITAQISEWQPPRFTDVPGLLFWGSVVLTVAAVVRLATRGWRIRPQALVGLIGFALLGALASRGVAWWPGVAVITVAGIWSDARPIDGPEPQQRLANAPRPWAQRPGRRHADRGRHRAHPCMAIHRCRDRSARRRAHRCAEWHHGRAPNPHATRGARLEPAGVGFMARVRGAGLAVRPRFANRDLPDRDLGRRLDSRVRSHRVVRGHGCQPCHDRDRRRGPGSLIASLEVSLDWVVAYADSTGQIWMRAAKP